MAREKWDNYFMKIASVVAERSTCLRHNIGAVIVREKRILTTGYNGAPSKEKDCLELGCLRNKLNISSGERHEICRAVHAEQNAIIQAAKYGIAIKGTTLYSTITPCIICAKMIKNAGIIRIVSYGDYADKKAIKFLRKAGVKIVKTHRPLEKIVFKD